MKRPFLLSLLVFALLLLTGYPARQRVIDRLRPVDNTESYSSPAVGTTPLYCHPSVCRPGCSNYPACGR
jgi:hypothetical protein